MENTPIPNSTELFENQSPAEEPISPGGAIFTLIAHVVTFLVGVPGNCLILRVYWSKIRKTSTHVLIMALAWADLSVCLLRWRYIAAEALLLDGKPIPLALGIIRALATTAIAASVLITAVIAADRYDCVCRSHNRFFTSRRAKLAVAASLLFSFAVNIPALIIAMSIDPSNTAMRMLVFSFQILCFVTALVMIALCYGLVYLTIRKHVQVGVDVLSNTRRDGGDVRLGDECPTIIMLRRDLKVRDKNMSVVGITTCINDQPNTSSNTDAKNIDDASSTYLGVTGSIEENPTKLAVLQKDSSAEKHMVAVRADRNPRPVQPDEGGQAQKVKAVSLQRKTTRMLFITSVVFLLTWLPYWTSVGLEFASYGGANINPTFLEILTRSSVTLYINNAVNPLIYGIANRRFRKDCREVLRKIRPC